MGLANVVLEYLKVLIWPTVLAFLFLFNRTSILAVLKGIPDEGSAEITGLGKYSWKRRVQEVAEEVLCVPSDDAAERRKPGAEILPTKPFDRGVGFASGVAGVTHRTWDELRILAIRNPVAAVLMAWQKVEFLLYGVAYAEKAPLSKGWEKNIAEAARFLGAEPWAAIALGQLSVLADHAEEGAVIAPSAALTFIDTAERATEWVENHSGSAIS